MRYLEVSEEHATAVSNRDFLKDEVARVHAQLDGDIRMKWTGSGRLTEASIENQILLDPKYQEVKRRFLQSCQAAELTQATKEAFMQRAYVLKDLATLYVAGYWSTSSVRGQAADELTYQNNREAIRQDRVTRTRVQLPTQ